MSDLIDREEAIRIVNDAEDVWDSPGRHDNALAYIRASLSTLRSRRGDKVAYICDGRACDGDCVECFRTTDISHAKNFELCGDAYMEKRVDGRCESCDLADLTEAFAHDYVKVAVDKAFELMTWRPADINTPEEIGAEHVLVTIRWAEDDLEVCEMDPMVMKEYNVIAWQPLPKPYKGDAK